MKQSHHIRFSKSLPNWVMAFAILFLFSAQCKTKTADSTSNTDESTSNIVINTDFGTYQDQEIHWLDWEELQIAQAKEPKKVFIDVYTNWCGWCKKMDASTFKDKAIAGYINEHYYAVKFNAETKEEINFDGKTYKFVPNGNRGYNELANSFLSGKLSYPTMVYLDEELGLISAVPGYQSSRSLETMLVFLGENHYDNYSWQEFEKAYQSQN